MSQINATNSLSQIMADIDLGPTGSLQFMFAKLQMAQSQICKNEAESYMKQIETIQEEQELCAKMIEEAKNLPVKGMGILVDECNTKAVNLYKSFGFQKEGANQVPFAYLDIYTLYW